MALCILHLELVHKSLAKNMHFYLFADVMYIVLFLNCLTLKKNLEGFAQTGNNDDANGKAARMTILI